MIRQSAVSMAAALALLMVIGSGCYSSLRACAVCAEIPGTLGAVHPESIRLAVAIRREIDAGLLEHGRPSDGAPDPGGVELVWKLRSLTEPLEASLEEIEFLLIETGTKVRIDAGSRLGPVIGPATQKLPAPRVRWVTGKDVLHALLESRIDVLTAIDRGVLVAETLTAPASNLLSSSRNEAGNSTQANASNGSNLTGIATLSALICLPLAITLVTRVRTAKGGRS